MWFPSGENNSDNAATSLLLRRNNPRCWSIAFRAPRSPPSPSVVRILRGSMSVRIEEIIERIRREIADEASGSPTDGAAPADVDRLPAISTRPELDYLNRNWQLFDPLSEMRSHRRC